VGKDRIVEKEGWGGRGEDGGREGGDGGGRVGEGNT
jgi:hypothetical protein